MEVNLDVKHGEWFEYIGSKIDIQSGEVIWDEKVVKGVRVKVRNPAPLMEEQLEKRERIVEHVLNPKTKAMERISFFKELTFKEAKKEKEENYNYIIEDFEGFTYQGKPIECTRENKIAMFNDPAFDRFIGRCIRAIQSEGVKQQESDLKNSKPGSDGKMTTSDPE